MTVTQRNQLGTNQEKIATARSGKSKTPPKTVPLGEIAGSKIAFAAETLRDLRKQMGLSQAEFGRLANLSLRNISAMETSQKQPTPGDMRRINELARLRESLARIMKPDFIGKWLSQPNELFGGLKPLEVIERGEIDRVWRMIFHIQGGALS